MDFILSALKYLRTCCALPGVLLVVLVLPCTAQTLLTSPIDSDKHLSISESPYLITGELIIQNGARLSADPGVTLYMGTNAHLKVLSGSIRIHATPEQPVNVLSDNVRQGLAPSAGDWGQWIFTQGTTSTHLEHVIFEHGNGLAVYGSAPVFNYLVLRHHADAAITIDLNASPSGIGNQASDNPLNGIKVLPGDITGDVSWTLRGLPYVIASGALSIGQSPAITSVTPQTVEQGQSITLTVSGQRLSNITTAQFDHPGLTLHPRPGGNTHSATFDLIVDPTTPPGSATLQLQLDAGNISFPAALTIHPAQLAIESLQPNTIEATTGPTQIKVLGRHFTPTSEVLLNNSPLATTRISAEVLETTIPDQNQAGQLSVQVRTPSADKPDEFALSNTLPLTITHTAPPQITLVPRPLEFAPDNRPHTLTLALSKPDSVSHTLSLKTSNETIFTIEPAAITLAAGETQTTVTLIPLRPGTASLTIESSPLATLTEPVLISMDIKNAGSRYAPPVGIIVGESTLPERPVHTGQVYAHTVGIVVGESSLPQRPVHIGQVYANAIGIVVGESSLPQQPAHTGQVYARPITLTVGEKTIAP